jgi:cytochrome oxidase Cu insertion factor (SCO1/SenC/PrrC family)
VEGFYLGVQALPPPEASPNTQAHGTDSHDTYEVMHSGRFVLIDQQRRIRAYYDGQVFDPERVVDDIRRLIR